MPRSTAWYSIGASACLSDGRQQCVWLQRCGCLKAYSILARHATPSSLPAPSPAGTRPAFERYVDQLPSMVTDSCAPCQPSVLGVVSSLCTFGSFLLTAGDERAEANTGVKIHV
eukprot:358841-Chlamydomonas_euryale.AAC.4